MCFTSFFSDQPSAMKRAARWSRRRLALLAIAIAWQPPLKPMPPPIPIRLASKAAACRPVCRIKQRRRPAVVTSCACRRPIAPAKPTLLRGTKKEEVERGQVVAKPGSITPHTKFKAEVYVHSKDEGGRHTPFFNKYRPQFYFRTTDVTGEVKLPAGVEMVMPGDNVSIEVELINKIAMEKGLRFAIREGGRTVGAGVVVEIIE